MVFNICFSFEPEERACRMSGRVISRRRTRVKKEGRNINPETTSFFSWFLLHSSYKNILKAFNRAPFFQHITIMFWLLAVFQRCFITDGQQSFIGGADSSICDKHTSPAATMCPRLLSPGLSNTTFSYLRGHKFHLLLDINLSWKHKKRRLFPCDDCNRFRRSHNRGWFHGR